MEICQLEELTLCGRWEVIDVVRTLSTEKVKAGEEGTDSFKFSRFLSSCEIAFLWLLYIGGIGSL